MKILLVEDEQSIAQPLKTLLETQGWTIHLVSTVAQALSDISQYHFDAAIMDLGLPDGNGQQVCCEIAKTHHRTAILVLTARNDEDTVVHALAQGADDYISKPFRARELIERIRAILRRKGLKNSYEFGDVVVDVGGAQVFVNSQEIVLTAQEYRLLLYFIVHAGIVLERKQLLGALWDEGGNFVEDNTLTVTIKRLRQKLGKEGNRIETVRGLGYRWRQDNEK